METPLRSNGYLKYLVQIGWFTTAPNFTIAIFAQDIISKTKADAKFLMNYHYPKPTITGLPYLSPIVEEIDEEDEILERIRSTGFRRKSVELVHPN